MLQNKHVVFDQVSKRYGNVFALEEMSLAIDEGEFLFLIGPSGSGKTTTLRCLAGLETLTSGVIYVRGNRIDNMPPHKRDMALVWQDWVLFPHLNIEQNVEFGLKMRGVEKSERKKRTLEALDLVGLKVPSTRDVTQLSGGERQRVGLARALVTRPQVLLLDEPLASLDRNLRIAMQTELKKIHGELKTTFIYITHNQSEALAMADRIVVMNAGRVEQIGPPHVLFESPQTRFVAEFVGDNNILEGKVVSHNADGLLTVKGKGEHFKLICKGEMPPEGRDVTFIVRADKIRILSSEGGRETNTENTIPARIVGQEYIGSIVKFALDAGGYGTINVIQALASHSVLEEVLLSWKPDDTHLLPW